MSPLTPIEVLTEARRLHRSGEHAVAVKLCRGLLADIANERVVHDADPFALLLDATTLAGLASIESGDYVLGRTTLEEVQIIGEPRPIWDVIEEIDDVELKGAVAHGQVKLVELYAGELVAPDLLARWVQVARHVGNASGMGLVRCFAEHQRLRALRINGDSSAAIQGWLRLAERIRRETASGAHPAGYPADRSVLEALATEVVLHGEGSALARSMLASLDASLLDPWDHAVLRFLVVEELEADPPTDVHRLDPERYRARVGAWFDGLREPKRADVMMLEAALAGAQLSTRLFYPWFSVCRRKRRGSSIPSELLSMVQDALDEAHHTEDGAGEAYALPRDARGLGRPADASTVARLISL